MQLGMVGLGRMGANIVRRLMRDGHDCVVYDVSAVKWRYHHPGASDQNRMEWLVAHLIAARRAR